MECSTNKLLGKVSEWTFWLVTSDPLGASLTVILFRTFSWALEICVQLPPILGSKGRDGVRGIPGAPCSTQLYTQLSCTQISLVCSLQKVTWWVAFSQPSSLKLSLVSPPAALLLFPLEQHKPICFGAFSLGSSLFGSVRLGITIWASYFVVFAFSPLCDSHISFNSLP